MGVRFVIIRKRGKSWSTNELGEITVYTSDLCDEILNPANKRASYLSTYEARQMLTKPRWPKSSKFRAIKQNYPDFKWMKK